MHTTNLHTNRHNRNFFQKETQVIPTYYIIYVQQEREERCTVTTNNTQKQIQGLYSQQNRDIIQYIQVQWNELQ